MKRRVNPNEKRELTPKRKIKGKAKKPYREPRLVVYGALIHLTRGAGRRGGDPGGHSRL